MIKDKDKGPLFGLTAVNGQGIGSQENKMEKEL